MNLRPSGARRTPGRAPGRAGAIASGLPRARRSLGAIRARIAAGFYDRDEVRDLVLRRLGAELFPALVSGAASPSGGPRRSRPS